MRVRSLVSVVSVGLAGCFSPAGSGGTSTEATTGAATTTMTGTSAATTTMMGTSAAPTTTSTSTPETTSTTGETSLTTDLTTIAVAATSDTSGLPAVCGNGVVEPGEMCDDGNAVMGPCPPTCILDGQVRYVFVTSESYTGKFGNVDAADIKCNDLAKGASAAEVLSGRYFKAWLSTSTESALERMGPQGGPYVALNGAVVAMNTGVFSAGALMAPIDVMESGAVVDGPGDCVSATQGVWTGTLSTGLIGEHCGDWTLGGNGDFATVGSHNTAASGWTECEVGTCASLFRLFCIESSGG